MIRLATAALGLASLVASASGSIVNIDFSTDDSGDPLANGQHIQSPDEFGALFNISASGNNAGAAVFDTDPAGPNASGSDGDLLVGLGNALILQNANKAAQSTPGFFDVVDDSRRGGSVFFDFLAPVELRSLTLIDIDASASTLVTLTDALGLSRTYDVPDRWTYDPEITPVGFSDLDLTTLADQPGETGLLATASEDAGFDASAVVRMTVRFDGSAALDNLVFVPTPGAAALAALGFLAVGRRRR